MKTDNALSALLSLFQTTLADVRFGDIDGKSLARAAAEVEAAANTVATAQATLDEARRELTLREESLTTYATRALAYARVYAETDPSLREQVEAIALPRSQRRGKSAIVAPTHPTTRTEPLSATKSGRRTAKRAGPSPHELDEAGFEESA